MSIIYVLIAVSVIVAVIFFIAFIVSVRNGQYDDTYTPSVRMLFEDELVRPTKAVPKKDIEKPSVLTETNQTSITNRICK